jgi:hypothetical protein
MKVKPQGIDHLNIPDRLTFLGENDGVENIEELPNRVAILELDMVNHHDRR